MADAFAEHLSRLLLLADLAGRLGASRDDRGAAGDVVGLALAATQADRVSLFAVENAEADAEGEPNVERLARASRVADGVRGEVAFPARTAGMLFSAVAGGGALSLCPVDEDEPFYRDNREREPVVPGAVALIPIAVGGRTRGVLEATRTGERGFEQHEVLALELAARVSATTVWLADRETTIAELFAHLLPEAIDGRAGSSLRGRLEAWLASRALGDDERRAISLAGAIVSLSETSSSGIELVHTVLSAAERALAQPRPTAVVSPTAGRGRIGRAGERTVWAPLVGLAHAAATAEDMLDSANLAELDALLSQLEPSASRDALVFAVEARRGADPASVDELGRRAVAALRDSGDARAAALLDVERLAVAFGARLDVDASASALSFDASDPELGAATLRLHGSIARGRADLGASLAHLEASRRLAESTGSARELVRTKNTLGTSYASLGLTSLARLELEEARELAEVAGMRQSSAVASGQLAVLAMDVGRPREAVRHLFAQLDVARSLSDTHAAARAHALLVEALSACHEPSEAREHADAARALYEASPTPWTALQAKMATAYEAEAAYLSGDRGRGDLALASLGPSQATEDRLVRARRTLVRLAARATGDAEGLADDLAPLRASPRPVWVERALFRATEIAKAAGDPSLVTTLAVRAACVLEARSAAGATSLIALRRLAEADAIARAMAIGRDLVLVARLALAPLEPFRAHVLFVTGDTPLVDAATVMTGAHPEDLLIAQRGPTEAVVVTTDPDAAARFHERLGGRREERTVSVRASALVGLSLVLDPS